MSAQKKNFTWLLIAVLVFLVAVPIAEDLDVIPPGIMRMLTFSWLLAVGVWSLRGFGGYFPVAIGLAVAGIVLSVLTATTPGDSYGLLAFAAAAGFIVVAVWCVASQVFTSREINANRVIGAVTLYLLFGLLWAIAYAVIESVNPGSIVGRPDSSAEGWSSEWLYFSFVTMTTLGYGDIAPVTATARTIAYLQAVFGQFYIAILVAGLVSAYITKYLASRD
jgi:hypothetical protein